MNDPAPCRSSRAEAATYQQSEIETILGHPFTGNNRVQLLTTGRETFQMILDSLSNAREVICIEFYIFKDDDTGKVLSEKLKEKAREGVKVYLLYDHFGSFLTSRRFWSGLRKAGVKVKVSNPFKWSAPGVYLYRNHKKLMVIDGRTALTGGFNIADEYHGYFKKRKTLWRDTGIYLEGPIASSLLDLFRKSWKTWKGDSIEGDCEGCTFPEGALVIPVFANSGRARRRMRRLLVYSIKNAKESIFLTTAYFIPGKKILRALVHAVRRGVTLRLLLPGQSDVLPVYYAGRSYYQKLLRAGVEIYNYQGAVLHAKTTVFDRRWSIVGSANLDIQSLRRNDESNVGVLDSAFSRQMIELFGRDLQNSFRIDPEAWTQRPLHQKILEKICYFLMKKL